MNNRKAIEFYEKGLLAEQQGRLGTAEKLYTKAIHFDKQLPGAHNNLGNIYLDKGLLAKAENAYRKALACSSDNPIVLNNIGNVLRIRGEHEKALQFFDQALSSEVDYFEALCNRGISLHGLGKDDEAIDAYKKALEVNPESFEANLNLGNVLVELSRNREAVDYYQNAIFSSPDSHMAHNGLGNAYAALGKTGEAKTSYLQAIDLAPQYEETYTNLANLLHETGASSEAETYLEKAMHINPDYAESYRFMSRLRKFDAADMSFISQVEKLRKRKKLPDEDLIQLDFALGKAYEDIGEYAKSFQCLDEGNRLRKKQLNYALEKDITLFDRIRAVSSRLPSLADENTDRSSDVNIVFIVGMPRSGTTLTEQILSSHSKVAAGGELELMNSIVGRLLESGRDELNLDDVHSIRRQYVDGVRELDLDAGFITDKMPLNFRWIGFILAAFPDAKIIHLCRNPIAVCWSNFKTYFKSRGNGFIYDLDDLVVYYDLYLDLMAYWNDRFPDRIYRLNYEQLTENQEAETRNLLAYCGLEFEQACLDFHLSNRAVKTASASQVREKIYQGSSMAWRNFAAFVPGLTERFGVD